MIIGVPRETKTHEYRVGMVPGGVLALTREGALKQQDRPHTATLYTPLRG